MSELRLLPAALCCWCGTFLAVHLGQWWVLLFSAAVGVVLAVKSPAQGIFTAAWGLSAQAQGVLYAQRAALQRDVVEGRVYALREKWIQVGGARVQLPEGTELDVEFGQMLRVEGSGTLEWFRARRIEPIELHSIWNTPYALAAEIRAEFHHSALGLLNSPARGLIPAMTLGDTSLQTAEEQQWYLDTGLAHLSAVSGGNVAIVTGCVVVLAALLRAPPRWQTMCALLTLGMYVLVVGPEPSVLRAGIMGSVGLVAVLANTRTPPMHALCIAVIAMMVLQPQMATSYGFALSAAATAGIVALSPILAGFFMHPKIPEVGSRAIAVTLAAQLSTAPLLAAMSGQLSLVALGANLLAAPVVPLITVLGLVAAILSVLPFGLEWVPLALAQPAAWWIGQVARIGAQIPGAVVDVPDTAPVAWVALGCCWTFYLLARAKLAGLGWFSVGLVVVMLWIGMGAG